MKKHLVFFAMFLALFSTKAFSQWTFEGIFPPSPDTLKTNSGVQFTAVDPDGKIWIAPYSTDFDSLFVPDSGIYKKVRPLLAFDPNGTEVMRITSVTLGGVLYPFYSTGYGLNTDHDGNILYCNSSTLYRINYQTGAGMDRVLPGISSLCSPAVDGNGNIYLAPVLPGYPVQIYNPDLTFNSNAIDTMTEYGRWITVSLDGNTLYIPRFTDYKLRIYHRASEFDPFELQDTVLLGIVCESGAWDPLNGNLWLSVGSFFGLPTGQFEGRANRWISFNTTTWAATDSIEWHLWGDTNADSVGQRPRGIAFSNDGMSAYCAVFGNSTLSSGATQPNVEKFSRPNSVRTDPNVVVKDYTLAQNYPNPFNPTTDIKFTVAKEGFVTLKVYDLLGKEVATLVNRNMITGGYTADFDASSLASGTYIYTLSVNGVSISKKMMLLK